MSSAKELPKMRAGTIQNRPYEFMVKYTPQREWIEGRGILLLLAFFFVELGAGAFIVASLYGNLTAAFIGWCLCGVVGSGCLFFHLGHPFRFWRMVLSSGWRTSWISRGLIFILLFLALGGIHMILTLWASPVPALLIVACVFAFCTIAYVGFVMSYVNSIPLWNTPLLPVLYTVLGLWGGFGVTLLTLLGSGAAAETAGIEQGSRIFLVAFVFIVLLYLSGIRYQGASGKVSVREIVSGVAAPIFWVVVVVFGMALPLGVALGTWFLGLALPGLLLSVVVLLELLGDLMFRYCILRCGFYAPLVPERIS
jgi:formate-dependent nitrite reductase membrane component NrfD